VRPRPDRSDEASPSSIRHDAARRCDRILAVVDVPDDLREAKNREWERVLGYILGNQAAWIVDIGLRTGLIRTIADADGTTSEALAEALGFDPHLTGIWARAAYAHGIVDWSEERGYSLGDALRAIFLDPTDPQFLGGRLQFYTALYEDFRAFPSYLATGGRWARSEHDPWLLVALANLSRPDASMITDHAIASSPRALDALTGEGSLLDVGSGGGHHLVHYAKTYPSATIVGLEPDAASRGLAAQAIADAGVHERVTVIDGDANDLDGTGTFDVATLSITLHETGGPGEWRNVLRRVFGALRPGGTVIVSELPYPDSVLDYRADPVYKMLAGVQLHEAIVGCGAITQGTLAHLVRDAGFVGVRVVDQPMKARHVVMGERPD
jgi:SAM-dependent methyltransferase